ncbi:hypothetical protein [Ornithinimicrobium cavernae]|uniref:restriction system modified-DNA reader domain-containing protein n=1 Tax=Ornithinimicrobium cavernae TaxID=2666047 RepID=UPI00137B1769|nr:hypothetical protein [Ornithinimicrobium cavernae]
MYVKIEDDLAELLEQNMHLDESHEAVVNRLLRGALLERSQRSQTPSPAGRTRTVVAGELKDLLRVGLVRADDEVRYTERRRDAVHVGRITADGRIATDGRAPASPSSALGQLVGYSINGWKFWVHVPSGKTLSVLRDGLSS